MTSYTAEKLLHGVMCSLVMGVQLQQPCDAWQVCHSFFRAGLLLQYWCSYRPYTMTSQAPRLMYQSCLGSHYPHQGSTACGPLLAVDVICLSAA